MLTALAGANERAEPKVLIATSSIKNWSAVGVGTVRTGRRIVLGSWCRRGRWGCLTNASHDGCRIGYVRQGVSTGRDSKVGDNRLDISPGIVIDAGRGRMRRDVDGCVVGMDALGGYGQPVGQEPVEKFVGVLEL